MKEFVEKLIKRLEETRKTEITIHGGRCNGKTLALGYAKGIENSIEIVNQLAEEHGKEINVPSKWIPCSERLPVNNKVVLCWVRSTTIASGETFIIGSCDRGFWFLQTYEIGHHHFPVKDYEVVAWMPLPEPYKQTEQQEEPQPNFYSERFNRVQ